MQCDARFDEEGDLVSPTKAKDAWNDPSMYLLGTASEALQTIASDKGVEEEFEMHWSCVQYSQHG